MVQVAPHTQLDQSTGVQQKQQQQQQQPATYHDRGVAASALSSTAAKTRQALRDADQGTEDPGRHRIVGLRVDRARSLRQVLKAVLVLLAYLAVSVSVMCVLEAWTFIDSLYFALVVMSTVGYGDLSPTSAGARIFVIFMIITGVVFVFSAVAGVITMGTEPFTKRGRQWLEHVFPQIPIDIDGDGVADYMKPRPSIVYYIKNLLPSLALTVILQLVSAAIFCAIDPSWDYGSAMYHCIVTATTVGFGDVPNLTQAGRLWSCFHILLSVALLGELISTFDDLRQARAKTMARISMLTTRLSANMLDNLLEHAVTLRPLVERDGLGLTELEFCLAMMIELGVVEVDQVQPFIKQFRLLDADGNARLGRDDLQMTCNKSLAELQTSAVERMKSSKRMSVGDRIGLSIGGAHRPSEAARDDAVVAMEEL